MNIELRKIYVNERFSEETTCFTAEIYIDGVKAGYAKNNGQGGCTDYYHIDGQKELIQKAEKYCSSLPDKEFTWGTIKMDLESYIDDLVFQHLTEKDKAKFDKKMKKDFLKGICIKTAQGYRMSSWKGHTLASIMQRPDGRIVIQNAIKELQKKGEVILNDNLKEFGVNV